MPIRPYSNRLTMKPFVLLGPRNLASASIRCSTAIPHQHFTGLDQEVNNALENNWGNINLYQATANSVNTVFMNVNEHLTPKRTAAIAREAGIQGDIDENSMYNVLGINAPDWCGIWRKAIRPSPTMV